MAATPSHTGPPTSCFIFQKPTPQSGERICPVLPSLLKPTPGSTQLRSSLPHNTGRTERNIAKPPQPTIITSTCTTVRPWQTGLQGYPHQKNLLFSNLSLLIMEERGEKS